MAARLTGNCFGWRANNFVYLDEAVAEAREFIDRMIVYAPGVFHAIAMEAGDVLTKFESSRDMKHVFRLEVLLEEAELRGICVEFEDAKFEAREIVEALKHGS